MPDWAKASLTSSRSPKKVWPTASKSVVWTEAGEARTCTGVAGRAGVADDRGPVMGRSRPGRRSCRGDVGVDARADRPEAVGVLQAREVAQLVRGDGDGHGRRSRAEVAAGWPAPPRRPLTLMLAESLRSRFRQSMASEAPASDEAGRAGVVEDERGVGPLAGRCWVNW